MFGRTPGSVSPLGPSSGPTPLPGRRFGRRPALPRRLARRSLLGTAGRAGCGLLIVFSLRWTLPALAGSCTTGEACRPKRLRAAATPTATHGAAATLPAGRGRGLPRLRRTASPAMPLPLRPRGRNRACACRCCRRGTVRCATGCLRRWRLLRDALALSASGSLLRLLALLPHSLRRHRPRRRRRGDLPTAMALVG